MTKKRLRATGINEEYEMKTSIKFEENAEYVNLSRPYEAQSFLNMELVFSVSYRRQMNQCVGNEDQS